MLDVVVVQRLAPERNILTRVKVVMQPDDGGRRRTAYILGVWISLRVGLYMDERYARVLHAELSTVGRACDLFDRRLCIRCVGNGGMRVRV